MYCLVVYKVLSLVLTIMAREQRYLVIVKAVPLGLVAGSMVQVKNGAQF